MPIKISEANKIRIIYFLVFCCTASWLPLFADYLKDRGISEIKSGIILSIPPFTMFLVQPIYGMVADRVGYKKSLLWSSGLAFISYLFYSIHGGFMYLFGVTVFMALFYNALQPILDSLSLRLVKNNPGFSYGTLRIAGAAGWSLTGIVAGHYIDAVNIRVIFVISAISMLLTFIFSLMLVRDKASSTVSENQSFKNIREVFESRMLIFLLISVFLVSTGATTIWNFYSMYMKENGASASLVGYGLSFQGLCELPLFYFSARIIKLLGLRATLVITIFTTSLRLLLYSIVKNPLAAIPIEVLHGISWSLFWVVCVEYVNRLVREDWRVTGQSLLYAAYFGVGQIAGNFWTAYLTSTKMRIADVFQLNAGLVCAVGLFVFIFFRRRAAVEKLTS